MEKLKMHTPDLAEENYKKLAALFPDAVTETIDENGNVVRAIDKDVLMQEINAQVVDDGQERYQFTWPDKRKSVVLANAPITKTLRFEKEKSVGRDGTPGGTDSENIYIEGDNLDALKLLQETYLGKVKMIYIDPPYNTGSDFIYEDDFSKSAADYADNSGQIDEEGNRLVQNAESNGRFHTDWLNMIYPRLRLAKDLLAKNGLIFISIDDNEQDNLRKMCDEVFGTGNFVNAFIWNCSTAGGIRPKFASKTHEYILCYAKEKDNLDIFYAPLSDDAKKLYSKSDKKGLYRDKDFVFKNKSTNPNQRYLIECPDGEMVRPKSGYIYRFIKSRFDEAMTEGLVTFKKTETGPLITSEGTQAHWNIYIKKHLGDALGAPATLIPKEMVSIYNAGTQCVQELFDDQRVFENVKPVDLIAYLMNLEVENTENAVIMDFFSGSATTAHAVLLQNSKDRGNRKYIMVQIADPTGETSVARQAGYKTISAIGEERIRRAGKKIKEETSADIDYGFRCFKVDSSNMKDVYYRPADIGQMNLDQFTDNIKEDRTPDDLLIQVMLDLGILLSSKVEETEIAGKKVFSVADGYLIACFDKNVTEDVVTAIAKQKPFYAVFRDNSMANDSVAANFEQIFATYSPQTVRKVL